MRVYNSFENIEFKQAWTQSDNAAGMVFNKSEEHSTFNAFYDYQQGEYKNYNVAPKIDAYGLNTESYKSVNNFYLYGNITYKYGTDYDQAWRGTVDPESVITPVVDSIPGRVVGDYYDIQTKVGYRANDRFSYGVAFDYQLQNIAKQRDGRNENYRSYLNVAPGVAYNSGLITFGLNLSYKRDIEHVDYDFVGDSYGYKLHYFEGLFFYTSSTISTSTMDQRWYFKNYYGGAAQVELKLSSFSFLNELSYDMMKQNSYQDNNRGNRFNCVDGFTYDYTGTMLLRGDAIDNRVILKVVSDKQNSYNVYSIYEAVEGENNTYHYYEYGETLQYIESSTYYGIDYRGALKRDRYSNLWGLNAGFNYLSTYKRYKYHPTDVWQDCNQSQLYVGVDKNCRIGDRSVVDVKLTYINSCGDGVMIDGDNYHTEGSLIQNQSLLEQDFAYKTAKTNSIAASLKYTFITSPQRAESAYIKIDATYTKVSDPNIVCQYFSGYDNTHRGLVCCTLGLNF